MLYECSYIRFINCGIFKRVLKINKPSNKEAIAVVEKLSKKLNDGFKPTIRKLESIEGKRRIRVRLPKDLTEL